MAEMRRLLTLSLFFIIVVVSTAYYTHDSREMEEQYRRIKAEKDKILNALNLPYRPEKIKRHMRNLEDDKHIEVDKIDEIVNTIEIIPDKGGCRSFDYTSPLSMCYIYTVPKREIIYSADMVIRLRHNIEGTNLTISVYAINGEFNEWDNLEKLHFIELQVNDEPLRVQVNIFDSFKQIRRDKKRLYRIDTRLDGIAVDVQSILSEAPVLQVGERVPRHSIQTEQCQENSVCCLKSFYVNFTEIGWGDWIISPAGFYANYCQGGCPYNTAVHSNNKDPELDDILRTAKSNNSEFYLGNHICAPRHYGPLKIMYAPGENDVREILLDGMRVFSCSCDSA